MNTLMSLALLFLVSVYSTEGLSCYCPTVCSEDAIEQIKQGCKGGVVDDACHCCKVCAKLEGETCGGLWDLEGRCDQGLFCKTPGESSPYSMKRGICVKNQLAEVATNPTEIPSSSGSGNESDDDHDDDTIEENSGEETEEPTTVMFWDETDKPTTEPATAPPTDYATEEKTTEIPSFETTENTMATKTDEEEIMIF